MLYESLSAMNKAKDSYRAGFCNIGEREVAIRQKLLLFALIPAVVLTIVVHFFNGPVLYAGLFLAVLSTVIILLEIKTRFCILFAIFSLHNFKEPGNLDDVTDAACRRKDRKKALLYFITAVALSLPYVSVIWFFTR